MRQVQLEELQDHTAEIVAEAEAGQTVTLLRGVTPVARIVPVQQTTAPRYTAEERAKAREELHKIMEHGYDLGIVWNGRDELYDRD